MTTLFTPPNQTLWVLGLDQESFYQRCPNFSPELLETHSPRSFSVSASPTEAIVIKAWNGELLLDYVLGEFRIISVSSTSVSTFTTLTKLGTALKLFDGCMLSIKLNNPRIMNCLTPGWDITGADPDYMLVRSDVYEKAVNFRWTYFLRLSKSFFPDNVHKISIPFFFSMKEVVTERTRVILRQHPDTPREWRVAGASVWKIPSRLFPQLRNWFSGLFSLEMLECNVQTFLLSELAVTRDDINELKKLDLLAWVVDSLLSLRT